MAVNNVTIQGGTGVDGNAITKALSNDQLTSEDFLRLMLEEMKMQDPTKPMDSQALMDSQLKMSTLESNIEMTAAMKSLQQSYATSALSTAANMIGRVVEDGSTDDKGQLKSYKVETVENKKGDLYVNVREIIGIKDGLINNDTKKLTLYDADGFIYEDDKKTDYKIVMKDGRFDKNSDGSLKLMDKDNNEVTDQDILNRYAYAGSNPVYAKNTTALPVGNIVEIR